MDDFSALPVIFYTSRVQVRGEIRLPFRRSIDLLNSPEREYLQIERAVVAPLTNPAQVTGPNPSITTIQRTRILLAGMDAAQSEPQADDRAAARMVHTACLGFIGALVFHAKLPLFPGQRILDMLESLRSDYIIFYDAALYLADRPDLPPHQHAGIAVSRHELDVIYLLQ